jgi:hypothetical protein
LPALDQHVSDVGQGRGYLLFDQRARVRAQAAQIVATAMDRGALLPAKAACF